MLVFDTLQYAKKLQIGGFSPAQAEAQAEALKEIVENNLATKQDILDLKRDIKEMEANLNRDMAEIKPEMVKWMFGMSLAQISIIVALIKLIP